MVAMGYFLVRLPFKHNFYSHQSVKTNHGSDITMVPNIDGTPFMG